MSYSLPAGLGVAIMRAIEEAGYELVPKGQPRQADPSGAASSTTSEQPANPAARAAYYCTAKSGILVCCAVGHDGPHESFGGVQW